MIVCSDYAGDGQLVLSDKWAPTDYATDPVVPLWNVMEQQADRLKGGFDPQCFLDESC